MNKYIRYTLVFLMFVLLIVLRAVASKLFYDPLISYFKNDYLYAKLPEINNWKLIINMLFRYVANTLVSLVVIWLLFQKQELLKFSVFFFLVAFIILITIFFFLLKNNFESGYLLPFYVRRFIIHPMFLLLLLPAFYYQEFNSNKN